MPFADRRDSAGHRTRRPFPLRAGLCAVAVLAVSLTAAAHATPSANTEMSMLDPLDPPSPSAAAALVADANETFSWQAADQVAADLAALTAPVSRPDDANAAVVSQQDAAIALDSVLGPDAATATAPATADAIAMGGTTGAAVTDLAVPVDQGLTTALNQGPPVIIRAAPVMFTVTVQPLSLDSAIIAPNMLAETAFGSTADTLSDVNEPAALAVLLSGLVGLTALRRRSRPRPLPV